MPERSIKRPVQTLTYVAAVWSVLLSALAWFLFFGEGSEFQQSLSLWVQQVVLPNTVVLGALIGVVLNIRAGSRGGRNRVICVVAGLIMIAPLVAWLVAIATYDVYA